MGLFGRIAAGLEVKATDISALTWERLLGSPSSKAGVAVNIDSALRVSTVFAAARVLANGIAQVPLKVWRESPDGTKALAKDHPVYKLLWRQPNEWMTSFELRQVMMFHAVLSGNAYAYIGRGGSPRRVIEIIPLVPEHVRVRQNKDRKLVYEVLTDDGGYDEFSPSQIMHLRGPMWNGYAGMDAIHTAREAIGLAIATEESHARLHSNGAKPGGLLSVEGTLSKEGRERLKAGLAANVEGIQNAYKTLVLDQSAKWTPFGMTGVDAQHLDTRRFQIEEICRDLGVFPQMVGYADKTATFASAEAFFQAHVTHSLMPWAENWQQVFSRDLLPEDDLYAEFALQGLLRGDHKARAEFYASGIVNGWLVRNEARKLENLNPLDGLDDPLVPLNMGTQSERDAAARDIAEAVKSMIGDRPGLDLSDLEAKVGRVLSARNENRIMTARDELNAVLGSLPQGDE